MAEIIPAIIPKDFAELEAKIKLVEPHVKTVQLDVMDGIFVPNITWPFDSVVSGDLTQGKPSVVELELLKTNVALEAHLMIDSPHRVLNEWLASPVKRIILHWEAVEKIHNHELLPYKTQVDQYFPVGNLADEVHRCNKELGLALNPQTPLSVLDNFISKLDVVLLMSVNPGTAGQEFQPEVIPRIKQLRQRYPDVKIGVDGGLGPQNIKEAQKAGADFLVVNSAIFSQPDIGRAISDLREKINQ